MTTDGTTTAAPEVWRGCYGQSWHGLIVREAFSHPAKFSRSLIERIVCEGLRRRWWGPGDVIGDPFGGVATGGIICGYHGIHWIGVELEPHFVELAETNLSLHRRKWQVLFREPPQARIIQGDGRNFTRLISHALDAVISSPPYGRMLEDGGPDHHPDRAAGGHQSLIAIKAAYGRSSGQISALPLGRLDAIISSPPYNKQTLMGGAYRRAENNILSKWCVENGCDPDAPSRRAVYGAYGTSSGQIGHMPDGTMNFTDDQTECETYWSAMTCVWRQCCIAMRPGGVLCAILRDSIRDGKRLPLADMHWTLLRHVGFEPVTRVRALMTEEQHTADLFQGVTWRTRSWKSFFRRMAESRGTAPIDWEDVLVMRRRP